MEKITMVQDISFAPLDTPLALPIKRYDRELQLIAVNKLLSDVYGRAIEIHQLLLLDLDRSKVMQLEYFGMQSVAETFVERLKEFLRSPISGDRNFQIVSRHYGLDGKPSERLTEIADRMSLSRERVRQLEVRSLMMLKAPTGFKFIRSTLQELARSSMERMAVAEGTSCAPVYQTNSSSAQAYMTKDPEITFGDCTLSTANLESLTDQQQAVFEELNKHRHAVIGGCAGSGKTLLAVLKAKQLAESGMRTLLTCYNRPLADHLLANVGDVPNLHILTFHALCYRHAKSANIAVPAGKTTHIWNETFPRLLTKAVSMFPERRYDAIVVDEGQDFHPSWWQALESTLRSSNSRFYVFHDNNQMLQNRRSYIPEMPKFELNENVRNSSTISRMIQRFYTGPLPLVGAGVPGQSIESYEYETLDELERTLDFVLERVMHELEVTVEDIVILTPKLPKFSLIKEAKLASGVKIVYTDSRLANRVLCSRIHTFKGLERRVVILIDLDDKFMRYSDSERDAMCYVAFSRATDHLVLMGQSDVIREVLERSAS